MIFASLMLSFVQQEMGPLDLVEEAVGYPKIGSENALAVEKSFRDWSLSTTESFSFPMSYEYAAGLSFMFESDDEETEFSISALVTSDVRSLKQMHHRIEGKVVLGDDAETAPFELEILLDGENLWIYFLGVKFEGVDQEGFLLRCDQGALENTYSKVLELCGALGQARNLEGMKWASFYPETKAILPQDLGTLVHPDGLLHFLLRLCACREMNATKENVKAFFNVDQQKGSYIRNARNGFLVEARKEKWLDADGELFIKLLKEFFSGVGAEITMNPTNGSLQMMEMDSIMILDEGLLPGLKESFAVSSLYMEGSAEAPTDSDLQPFVVPGKGLSPFNATPFVTLALTEVQAQLDALASSEDSEF